MAESKHTPGPWIGFSDPGNDVAIFPAGRDGTVCEFAKPYPSRADAQVMIAAPEMLPIVELIAGIELPPAAEGWPDDRSLIGYRETVITVGHVRAARAAISKATGSAS